MRTSSTVHNIAQKAVFALGAAAVIGTTLIVALPHDARAVESGADREGGQNLVVSESVRLPRLDRVSYEPATRTVASILADSAPAAPSRVVADIAESLPEGGARVAVVARALSYLGVPYVFGGAGRSGVDCSGLVMLAYRAIGLSLHHGVSAQDARGVRVGLDAAKPGDLVVYDDHEHIGIYLGKGRLIAAPAVGRSVEIQELSNWSGAGYHLTRLLP